MIDAILTLAEVQRLAMGFNPNLAARGAAVRARAWQMRQTAALPNPEITTEVEDLRIGQRGASAGAMQVTAMLTQRVELGGERDARTTAAGHRRDAAAWEFEIKRLQVLRRATAAFVDLLAAQQRHRNAEELAGLAQETVEVLESKGKAGKVTPLEIRRAKVTLALSRIEIGQAELALQQARQELASLWGSATPTFRRARGGFPVPDQLPAIERLRPLLADHPALERAAAVVAEARTQVDVERRRAIPDLEIGVGYRWLSDVRESALVAAIAAPLPLFDQNRDQIEAAGHQLVRAEQELASTRLDLDRELGRTYRTAKAALFEVEVLNREVLAEARSSYEAVVAGYHLGRFGFLDLIDAQRTLFEAVQRSVEARAAFFKAAAEVESLAGTALFDWTPGNPNKAAGVNWHRDPNAADPAPKTVSEAAEPNEVAPRPEAVAHPSTAGDQP